MNLENGYPGEAGIKSLEREVVHDTENDFIEVVDKLEMKSGSVEMLIPIYTPSKPDIQEGGRIVLGAQKGAVLIFDPKVISVKISEFDIDDEKLLVSWDSTMYKIELCNSSEDGKIEQKLRFEKLK